jgi:hypothetical protein
MFYEAAVNISVHCPVRVLPWRFCYQFQVIAVLATLTASSLATPVSVLDHYSPLRVAVSQPAVAIAHHVPVEVEHYVSAAVGRVESPY